MSVVGSIMGHRPHRPRWLRWLLILGIVALVAGLAMLIFALWPTRTPKIDAPQTPQAALVEKGRYLAILGDCTACHTREAGGAAFAGGDAINSPVGAMYPTNITPDRQTGIGDYTLDDFDRAVRHGIRKTGATLYPAMPYPSYISLTDADVTALYAYFMLGVKPVNQANRADGIPFPLSMRWPVAIWRKAFAPAPDQKGFDAARFPNAQIARGAYLSEGLGHCGSCHTPRAFPTMQEKALNNGSADYLAGGIPIDGWYPVNLRGNMADGLGRWSPAQIAQTLATARNDRHAVVGSAMNGEIAHSSSRWKPEDLAAISAYLKTLSPSNPDNARYTPDTRTAQALSRGEDNSEGAALYLDNCAGCHRTTGEGDKRAFPAMAGNNSVLAVNPTSLVRLVLGGSALPALDKTPSALTMPAFYWRLNDDQVATLLTYIRQNWGNQAAAVKASDVASVRSDLKKTMSKTAQAAAPDVDAGENRP